MAPAPTLGWARLHGHRHHFWETQENNLSSWAPGPRALSPPALPSAQKACRRESKMQGVTEGMGCTAPGGTAERFTGRPDQGSPRFSCRRAHRPVTWHSPPAGPFLHLRHTWNLGLDSAWIVWPHPWVLSFRSLPQAAACAQGRDGTRGERHPTAKHTGWGTPSSGSPYLPQRQA